MINEHEPLIVNAIGHLAGAIIFGIFLVLVLRGGAGRRARESWLSLASAGLAWTWNAVSFMSIVLTSGAARWAMEAVSFSSLSLLPAVLLHLSLNGKFRIITATGYFLSVAATAMHLCEDLLPGAHLHKWALWLIAVGFGALTIVSAVRVLLQGGQDRRGKTSQLLAAMGLLLFVVTVATADGQIDTLCQVVGQVREHCTLFVCRRKSRLLNQSRRSRDWLVAGWNRIDQRVGESGLFARKI